MQRCEISKISDSTLVAIGLRLAFPSNHGRGSVMGGMWNRIRAIFALCQVFTRQVN